MYNISIAGHNPDTRSGNNWYERPHEDLVADIRSAAAHARAEAEEQKQPFDAVKWAGDQLTSTIPLAFDAAHINRIDTSLVWDGQKDIFYCAFIFLILEVRMRDCMSSCQEQHNEEVTS